MTPLEIKIFKRAILQNYMAQENNNISNGVDNPNQDQKKIKNKQIEAKMENYVGPEGISTKALETGLWYVEHKEQLRMSFYGILILVAAVSWSYTIYGLAYYLARGMNEDEILTKQLVQASSIGHDYVKQISARELSLSPVGILASGEQKYDFYAILKNDNEKWWAEFDYYFLAGGSQTEKKSGYVMPSENKYLMALAQNYVNQPVDGRLIMENIKWHRISPRQITDWGSYLSSHLNIESKDVKFTPAALSALSLNQLSFSAVNHTAYNFWEMGFTILLTGGGQVVALNHYGLSDFLSGQTRQVQINWTGNLGSVDKVDIIPEINIMKNDIYIPYEGGIGQEK